MAGELVVADNQYQLRDLLIGPTSLVRWHRDPPTWWGIDRVRTADVGRDGEHGVDGGIDRLDPKIVAGELVLLASGSALASLIDEVGAAWAPSDVNLPFVAQIHGEKRRRYGRPRRWALNPRRVATTGHPVVVVQFEALDPLVYSDTEHSRTTGRTVSGAGFTPPFTVPFTLGTSTSGSITVTNAGSTPAPWRARLDGPLTNPQIRHVEQGRVLDFDGNGGLDIGAGQWVDVAADGRSVLLQGTADRRINLRLPDSRWFLLDPGDNTIELAADAGDGAITFLWRDTWT